ncbi:MULTISPECIES: VanZ family protein [Psychrobacillus]|uniref:VanZ family protein n=1 Tax=Psychrobacillus faecigallinarum TaxID=2762235 RepID=A0ABR8REN5_9BACI|nr:MULTISPECIES: VanZ family protein [Psychrobacillus]MBD7946228.1 VanZ family protein [Psychrobacillus faecigallinarum]QEY22201.1 VanZ family protein [Psychrobacillus sp. AK 1817]QGM29085.1 VanZ family protein [Bacillus sp. N3536]
MPVIMNYIDEMLYTIAIFLPVLIIWRLIRWKRRGFHLREGLYELGVLFLIAVLVGLFSQTIIPKYGEEQAYVNSINLELFRVLEETWNAIIYLGYWEPFYINFLGNIALFIPIGFLFPLVFKRMEIFPFPVIMGFLISLFIEIVQIPQNRSSDVDDLWLNSSGALVGYLIYLLVRRKFPVFCKVFKKNHATSL